MKLLSVWQVRVAILGRPSRQVNAATRPVAVSSAAVDSPGQHDLHDSGLCSRRGYVCLRKWRIRTERRSDASQSGPECPETGGFPDLEPFAKAGEALNTSRPAAMDSRAGTTPFSGGVGDSRGPSGLLRGRAQLGSGGWVGRSEPPTTRVASPAKHLRCAWSDAASR